MSRFSFSMMAAGVFAGAGGEQRYVVPGAHGHAVIQRHRPHRRVRKDEAHGGRRRQAQFGDDGREVVAVGAQAVQPDHRAARVRGGFDFHAVQ